MKKKLAIFTPLPPTKSGISDYSVEIGSELSRFVDIVYVIDDISPFPIGVDKNIAILRYSKWSLFDKSKYVCFYQIGNNVFHSFILAELQINPGFVLLHDISLHHLYNELCGDNPLTWSRYYRAIEQEAGLEANSIKEFMHRGFSIPNLFKFIVRLNSEVIKHSLGLVVHSQYAYDEIKNLYPKKKLLHLPFPFKNRKIKLNRLKVANNQTDNDFIISSFGFVTPTKQIEFILDALSNCREYITKFKYLIVGEVHPSINIKKKIRDLNLQKIVTLTGYIDFEKYQNYMDMSDLIITLRYPSAGETSAALLRSLGEGKANIVFNYESFSGFPDDVLYKIPLDTFDTQYLEKAIIKFVKNKGFKRKYELNAKKHILKYHNIKDVSQKLINFLNV